MRKPDIFDEILLCLKELSLNTSAVEVNPDVCRELYRDFPKKTEVPPQKNSLPHTVSPVKTVQPQIRKTEPVQTGIKYTHPSEDKISSASWEELEKMCSACQNCGLCAGRRNVVFGDGNRNADLMFIGEGPGADEDAQGIPFVGKAGQLLTKMIAAMQFDRKKDVYIANIVKCRPPNNRNPEQRESESCIAFLQRQIDLVNPKVIVLLGAVPLFYLMKQKGIQRLRGQWLEYNGIKVMPTYHPAFLLYDPTKKKDVWADLQIVMKEFGKVYRKNG